MKKVLALVIALCMVVSLCACGGSSAPATTPAPANNEQTPANNNAPATTEPADTEPAPAGIPVAADFPAGGEWDGKSEPTHDVGNWAQAYALIDALAEQAAAYANTPAVQTFTLACHDPVDSAPGEFLTAWANAVTIATEGAIQFNIGYSGTLTGTMASLTDMISGVVDFDWTLPCYFDGYMPLTNVIQNPSLGISNATVGSYAMWELYKNNADIQAEFADDGECLFVWTNCTSPLSYAGDKEITSTSEISGNIRANNGPAKVFISQVGASVYGCPIGDVYTNVSSGIINYLITDWHGISSFALSEVLNHYVDTNIGCSAYTLMANADVWDMIEALGYADAVKSVSGDYLLNLVSVWNFWEAKGRYQAVQNGGDIFAPSDELAAELDAAYAATAEAWIQGTADTYGIDVATVQATYDQAVALVNQYAAIYG